MSRRRAAPTPDHEGRMRRAREGVREARLEGLLLTHLPNVRYLSGFSGSSGMLLLLDTTATLITDFRYEQQAAEEVEASVAVRITRDGLARELADCLEEAGAPRVLGLEAEHVSVRERRELGEKCGRSAWEDAPPIVERLRARKEAAEVARIEEAARIAALAFEQTLAVVSEGATERDLAAELEYRLRRAGSEAHPFETIVAAGPRSALPHARPSGRRVEEGDLLLFDFGARVDGYCCDITRTLVAGPASPWQREAYDAVRLAQESALQRLAAGRPARAVDQAARAALESAGLLERFGHSTGHGLGLEVHEAPRLHRRSEETLRTGNVVTVEPGVYLPGRGGVRIEDDVLVVDGGSRVLTPLARAFRELA